MTAITISRGLGSLGDQVALVVAARLGFQVVGRDLLNQAARRAGAPEMALAEIDDLGLLAINPSEQVQRAYRQAVAQVMLELAGAGQVVIVGRAGCVALAGRADVLHVRISAPEPVRCRRLASRAGIAAEAASARVEASDRNRSGYLRRQYDVDWNDPNLYDLVVNTARLSPEAAGETICCAFACLQRRPDGSCGKDDDRGATPTER